MPLINNNYRRKSRGVIIAPAPFSDDVFSTLLYTGLGGQKALNCGLSSFNTGGIFWSKYRSGSPDSPQHLVWDTAHGVSGSMSPNSNASEATNSLISIDSSGVTLDYDTGNVDTSNTAGVPYVGWFWKRSASFLDIQNWGGDGTPNKVIQHLLANVPGMIILKSWQKTDDWTVYHRSSPTSLTLNGPTPPNPSQFINNVTASQFALSSSVGIGNYPGAVYTAWLFAHDPTQNGIIFCDSFTTDANGNATVIPGWPIQFLMFRAALVADGWQMYDSSRGPSALMPLTTLPESVTNTLALNATGFSVTGLTANTKYVYMAIRAKNKTTGPNVLNIPGGNSIDVYSQAIANGWDQVSALTVNVTGDVGSNSTSTAALIFNGTYPSVTVNIQPGIYVLGQGGTGKTTAGVGAPGGPGISTTGPITINNYGFVSGGGGAGGAHYTGAAAGANGAGLPIQTPPTGTVAATKTTGGKGAASPYGAGGVGAAVGASASQAPGGGGGGGGLGGTGGASASLGSGTSFTDPSGSGQGGAGLTDSDPTQNDHPTYAGGAPGSYAVGNSKITWVTTGTRYGSATA